MAIRTQLRRTNPSAASTDHAGSFCISRHAAALMPQFNAAARRLYENFMNATLRRAEAAAS